jgi:hypothetical protein
MKSHRGPQVDKETAAKLEVIKSYNLSEILTVIPARTFANQWIQMQRRLYSAYFPAR